MNDTINVELVKLRSERARCRLLRAAGVVNSVTLALNTTSASAGSLDAGTVENCRQALLLVSQILHDAACELEADVMVQPQANSEAVLLGEEQPSLTHRN